MPVTIIVKEKKKKVVDGVRLGVDLLRSDWIDEDCEDGAGDLGRPWGGGPEGVSQFARAAIRGTLTDAQIKTIPECIGYHNTWARRKGKKRIKISDSFCDRHYMVTRGRHATQDEIHAMQERVWGKS
jgi:hypothetical protein